MAWTLTFVGLALTFGRFVIRMRTKSSLKSDDFTQCFALLILIIYMAMYSALFPLTMELQLYSLKMGPKPSTAHLHKFFHLLVPTEIFFWVVIYLVKLTFMLLYQQIFGVKKKFMVFWWIVLTYTILTFIAAVLTVFWSCGSPSELFSLSP